MLIGFWVLRYVRLVQRASLLRSPNPLSLLGNSSHPCVLNWRFRPTSSTPKRIGGLKKDTVQKFVKHASL